MANGKCMCAAVAAAVAVTIFAKRKCVFACTFRVFNEKHSRHLLACMTVSFAMSSFGAYAIFWLMAVVGFTYCDH